MGFAERSINAVEKALDAGCVSERQIRDVVLCDKVDVSRLERFLNHPNGRIRCAAVQIIGEKGDGQALLNVAIKETNESVLAVMLRYLGKKQLDLSPLANLVHSDNSFIRETAIEMFRAAGQADKLFPLLFDEQDLVVQRVKRYLNEQENNQAPGPEGIT